MHYYNEIDADCCAWLRELMDMGCIPDGEIDQRSIEDVCPNDLAGFVQCHFFGDIGVWPYSLRKAGWPDDRPVWTFSCPCQSFSSAGKRAGFADQSKHLWPAMFHLIEVCRPPVCFGEQVGSKDGRAWFDVVLNNMEGLGFAVCAYSLSAAGFGAPHIRQRLYFAGVLGDSESKNRSIPIQQRRSQQTRVESRRTSPTRVLAQSTGIGRRGRDHGDSSSNSRKIQIEGRGPTNGFWSDAVWIPCRDGKWRPTKSDIFPLVAKSSGGVGHSGSESISEDEGDKEAERISFSCGCGAESVITELGEPCPKCGEIRDGYVTYGAWTTPCADDISDRKKKYEQGGSSLSFQAQQSELKGSSTEDPNNTAEARVMRLKGYGNALCAETAIEFVKAFLAVCGEDPGGD